MKTFIRNLAGQLATLLAWLCIVGIMFLGARNAHAQGFPVKPRFQDVRIGFTTFAECEVQYGPGGCDLTVESGALFDAGLTSNANIITLGLSSLNSITGAQITATDRYFVADGTQASPSFAAASFTQTGLWFPGIGEMRFSGNNDDTLRFTSQGIGARNSGASLPSFYFHDDPDVGMAYGGTNTGILTSASNPIFTWNSGTSRLDPVTGLIIDVAGGADEFALTSSAFDLTVAGNITFDGQNGMTFDDDTQILFTAGVSSSVLSQANADFTASTGASFDIAGGTDELSLASGSVTLRGGSTIAMDSTGNDITLSSVDQFIVNIGSTAVFDAGTGNDELTIGANSFVVDAATVTVNGQSVCLENGTDCPAANTPTIVQKLSPTSRNSTTTYTADPDLTYTATATGEYELRGAVIFNGSTTGTQGFKFCFGRTSAGSDNGHVFMLNPSGANTFNNFIGDNGCTAANMRYFDSDIEVASARQYVSFTGTVALVSGVTYAVQWAQNDSEANNTNLVGGYLSLLRVN